MSIYYDKQIPGELWFRDLKDNIDSANNILSSIFLKYENINTNFYLDLSSNNISRFDLFHDTIFVETPSGCIFEKFYIDNDYIRPYNQLNLFITKKNTTIDYWYDETKNKITLAEVVFSFNPYKVNSDKYIYFILFLREFDCSSGRMRNLFTEEVRIAHKSIKDWDQNIFPFENPKMTYNSDTKTFNVSFIFRNLVGEMALVSVNITNEGNPTIKEVNSFIPFAVPDPNNSVVKV